MDELIDRFLGSDDCEPRFELVRVLGTGYRCITSQHGDLIASNPQTIILITKFARYVSRYYYFFTGKNLSDLNKSPRFVVTGVGERVTHATIKVKGPQYEVYTYSNLQHYIEMLNNVKLDGCKSLTTAVIRAFRDRTVQKLQQVHVQRVSMFIWAAMYIDWINAEQPEYTKHEKTFFQDMFNHSFYGGSNVEDVILFKCFRGSETTLPSTDADVLKAIARAVSTPLKPEKEEAPPQSSSTHAQPHSSSKYVHESSSSTNNAQHHSSSPHKCDSSCKVKKEVELLDRITPESIVSQFPGIDEKANEMLQRQIRFSQMKQTGPDDGFVPRDDDGDELEIARTTSYAILSAVSDLNRFYCPKDICARQYDYDPETGGDALICKKHQTYARGSMALPSSRCGTCGQTYHTFCWHNSGKSCVVCNGKDADESESEESEESEEEKDGESSEGADDAMVVEEDVEMVDEEDGEMVDEEDGEMVDEDMDSMLAED